MDGRCVVIDGSVAGAAQKVVLASEIENAASDQVTVRCSSGAISRSAKNWKVRPEIAAAMALKLDLLMDGEQHGLVLYLSENCIIQGDVCLLFDAATENFIHAGPGYRIGQMDCFLLNYEAPDRKGIADIVKQLAGSDYDSVRDGEVPAAPLPAGWLPTRYWENPEAPIIDCSRIPDRPWYSTSAPGGEIWIRHLNHALENGTLSQAEIENDVKQGALRPSLLYQLSHGVENPFELPATVRDLDKYFVPPELALNAAQRKVVETTKFALPKRKWTKQEMIRIVRSYLGRLISLPRTTFRRAVKLARRLVHRGPRAIVRVLRFGWWLIRVGFRAVRDPIGYVEKLRTFIRGR